MSQWKYKIDTMDKILMDIQIITYAFAYTKRIESSDNCAILCLYKWLNHIMGLKYWTNIFDDPDFLLSATRAGYLVPQIREKLIDGVPLMS